VTGGPRKWEPGGAHGRTGRAARVAGRVLRRSRRFRHRRDSRRCSGCRLRLGPNVRAATACARVAHQARGAGVRDRRRAGSVVLYQPNLGRAAGRGAAHGRPGRGAGRARGRNQQPGWLAFDDRGMLIVGFGDGPLQALIGNLAGLAGLLLIDPDSGEARDAGYRAGHGERGRACGPTQDRVRLLQRRQSIGIDPHGTCQRRWAKVLSANGLAIDPAAGTCTRRRHSSRRRSSVSRSPTPGNITTYARPGLLARAAGLDGRRGR